jgi:hypothetical protein
VKKIVLLFVLAVLCTVPAMAISLFQGIEAGYYGDIGALMSLSLRDLLKTIR